MKRATFPQKIQHWNIIWSYNPQNTSESRRNQGERHETLEKQGCQTQNALKITIAGIGQGRTVSGQRCWRRRRIAKGAPTCRRLGNRVNSYDSACGSRTHLSVTRLGGLGCLRPMHLSVWAVSPHAPSKCMFQNTNLWGLLCISRCPRIFFLFWLKFEL